MTSIGKQAALSPRTTETWPSTTVSSSTPASHLNDHWDLDHLFERLLVDTAVAPDPTAVDWINPRLRSGEMRQVVTGIPGKTALVYTLDRETGEFLWATSTVAQNAISKLYGATGAVTENSEVVFSAVGQEVLSCPSWIGGRTGVWRR